MRLQFIFVLGLIAVVTLTSCSKTTWTKKEVVEWYTTWQSSIRGGLGYKGSDQKWHYFVARNFDSWIFIRMKKGDLTLQNERPVSESVLYAVDPTQDFELVPEGSQSEPDGAANGSQPFRSGTNSTPSTAGSRR